MSELTRIEQRPETGHLSDAERDMLLMVGNACLCEAGFPPLTSRDDDGNPLLNGIPPAVAWRAYCLSWAAIRREVPITLDEFLASRYPSAVAA